MRPGLLSPFLQALDKKNLETDSLLVLYGLSRRSIRQDTGMITARQVHQFLEHAASASGDPMFCWRLGWNLDHRKYPLFSEPLSRGLSLGATLTELSISAENLASATRYELKVEGAYSHFISHRLYKSAPAPHTDSFVASALVSLLKRFAKMAWNASEVSVDLAQLDFVPVECGCRLVQTRLPSQCTIRFPSGWLLPGTRGFQSTTDDGIEIERAGSLIGFLESVLRSHLADPGLTAKKAAERIGSPLREINQVLKPRGLTLAQLIDNWRKEEACQALKNQDLSVAQTGASVGYPDPTSFSRVFRRWTKMSPRDYRNSLL
jgi:AraC-like DNA-binding protein